MPISFYKNKDKEINDQIKAKKVQIMLQEEKFVSSEKKGGDPLQELAKLRNLERKKMQLIRRKKTNLSKLAKAERKGKI